MTRAPPARLRILAAGPGVTVQDRGRFGSLRYGVTQAGPMDWAAFRAASLALANADDAAGLEISLGGIEMVCEDAPLWLAFAGGEFVWRRDGAMLAPAARIHLRPGEILAARPGRAGAWTYLCVEGGIDTPPALGSRATHTRSAMGGLEGRMLRGGDLLPVRAGAEPLPANSPEPPFEARIEATWLAATWLAASGEPFRVVPGPQDDYFDAASLAEFFASEFMLTPAADRMAYRFEGPKIHHCRGYNIVSDGVALGAIQIAGDGQPLVLMADRQPTGGYPKIGHVIRADISRLAQLRPGEVCRFTAVGLDEARAALLSRESEVARTASALVPLRREPTPQILLEANLIDGVADALAEPRA